MWFVEGRFFCDFELLVLFMVICLGGIMFFCWVLFLNKFFFGFVVFFGNVLLLDFGCFRLVLLLLVLVICCWFLFILLKESVVVMFVIVEVLFKCFNIFFFFIERLGDEVCLLDLKIFLLKWFFSWWKVLFVKLMGFEVKFCDMDDLIFWMVLVMFFLLFLIIDNFFDFFFRFGVDWDVKGWFKFFCEE